jgi:hypothetical protein
VEISMPRLVAEAPVIKTIAIGPFRDGLPAEYAAKIALLTCMGKQAAIDAHRTAALGPS